MIKQVAIGEFILKPWYASPYPMCDAGDLELLYICERCMSFSTSRTSMNRHHQKCCCFAPPGKVIYEDSKFDQMVFEIDGEANRVYCQNMCLFCKLFLKAKSLSYDVDEFLFYILVVKGVVVGYFSKEKSTRFNYNLACILTFPQYHSLGYGKFLISLSYLLSRREGKIGNPEKPLSDHGLIAYRSFWKHVVLKSVLRDCVKKDFTKESSFSSCSIADISEEWAINPVDIIETIEWMKDVSIKNPVLFKITNIEVRSHLNSVTAIADPTFLLV